ncbi:MULTISPECIES: metalloregulator ArsR/SmtB family transcription factor [unclassified Granulicatella]|uniref:ArsR/SmtB family transcription factor n=1 Tax=unclassified Granulicatella TaxID=2630493 RepID=UPI001073D484|nr:MULTISPECIES: metalloregulator ArsR/SmtB family transcription factor [unclassified Granulicatella]MBF0779831.1 winged helix-turn-helix transcriptional regulator [Granulicatella sp. 19428wC4_WM01]TFU96131.1 ArsR family transcriptional regulator [Granulicatella sp. WM01]
MTYTNEELTVLSGLFKALGDQTRLNILLQLFDGELSVNEIAEHIGLSVSAISHQLKLLRLHKLIKSRKEGKYIFYSLDDLHVKDVIAISMQHISE